LIIVAISKLVIGFIIVFSAHRVETRAAEGKMTAVAFTSKRQASIRLGRMEPIFRTTHQHRTET